MYINSWDSEIVRVVTEINTLFSVFDVFGGTNILIPKNLSIGVEFK